MFFLARRLFRSDAYGAAGAVVLALTPANLLHSHIGTSQILVGTFTLSWLVCLARYFDTDRRRDLLLATMSLGFGIYTYPGETGKPEGKLRLMYEAKPLALIAERAGGAAHDGPRSRVQACSRAHAGWEWHLVHPSDCDC
jgi:hypothetical protein